MVNWPPLATVTPLATAPDSMVRFSLPPRVPEITVPASALIVNAAPLAMLAPPIDMVPPPRVSWPFDKTTPVIPPPSLTTTPVMEPPPKTDS